jgi:hypothetical protein
LPISSSIRSTRATASARRCCADARRQDGHDGVGLRARLPLREQACAALAVPLRVRDPRRVTPPTAVTVEPATRAPSSSTSIVPPPASIARPTTSATRWGAAPTAPHRRGGAISFTYLEPPSRRRRTGGIC